MEARGRAGGFLVMWDKKVLEAVDSKIDYFSVFIIAQNSASIFRDLWSTDQHPIKQFVGGVKNGCFCATAPLMCIGGAF